MKLIIYANRYGTTKQLVERVSGRSRHRYPGSVIEDPPRRTAIEDYLCKLLMSYPIDRKTDHLAGVGKSQLLFDVSSMGFNRFYAEIQLVGARFGVVSFTEHH